jgi:hypothetical protein
LIYDTGAIVCVLAYPFGIFKLFFSFHLFALAVVLKVKTMHVNQRTDNTIAKRKRTIAQTKDWAKRPHLTSRNKSKYIKCKTTLNSISIELNFLLIFYFVYSKSIMDLNYQNCYINNINKRTLLVVKMNQLSFFTQKS